MAAALSHIKDYFTQESPRDFFNAIDAAAQWACLAASLAPQGLETAKKVSLAAGHISEFFVWPQLIMDGRKLWEPQKKIYNLAVFSGTAAEALIHLHERSLPVLEVAVGLGKYSPPVRAVYFLSSFTIDIMEGYTARSWREVVKSVISITLTVLAILTLVHGHTVMPIATLILSTTYIGIKSSIWERS